ncbi:MAG TPA: hypothetical protein VGR56_05235 [Nitrososphaerales archaeon]|nr:hypothetical protein [Nitrososphaerales archaeon]
MSQVDFKAKTILRATISPSEDPDKVVGALEKILGQSIGDVSLGPRAARIVTDDAKALLRIRDQLRDRHVRSAARRRLLLNRGRNSTSLMLNRQAATSGTLVVCGSPEESPLGPIYLTIESERLDDVIDWLTSYSEG